MNPLEYLKAKRLPLFLQAELAECGLASLAMVAAYHGHRIDLNALRQRFALSLKGARLSDLISVASALNLGCRPLRLEVGALGKLALPCILHWDLNHFVVLKRVHTDWIVIHDPALGVRRVSMAEVRKHFSGVALEVSPAASFQPREIRAPIHLSDLWGRLVGWKRAIVQVLLLSALLQAFVLAAPSYLQLVVDEAILRFDDQFLAVIAAAFAGMYVLQSLTEALRGWVVLHLSQSIGYQIIGNLLHHLLRLPTDFFEKRIVGDILSRMGSVRPIQQALAQSVVTAALDGIMAVTTAIVLFAYSATLGAVVVGSIALYWAVVLLLFPYRRLKEEEQIIAHAEAQTYLIESIRASKTVKLMGREAQREVVWRNHFAKVVQAAIEGGKAEIAGNSARAVIFGCQIVLVVYVAATLVMRGEFTVGMLFALMLYRASFTDRADALVQRINEFRLLRMHLDRLADIVQTKPEEGLDEARMHLTDVTGSVALRDVGFRYAANEPVLFDHVGLEIRPGEFVAIIGPSGGGKTTLLKVMLGLLPPTSGELLVEGRPLKSFGISHWRSHVGVVQQDDLLLMGTIADNIGFFDPELDMDHVVESAKAAAIHDEIMAMPMGYLSLVGDMGSTLSGGQRQRVLLARALYRKPSILFLDEGTANLDADTERLVADMIQNMNITRIVIAHRPELVQRADRVYELNKGHLVQRQDVGVGLRSIHSSHSTSLERRHEPA